MEEQKISSPSFLASLGLAAVGAVIFIAAYFLVVEYSSLLNSQSLLIVWVVMLVLVLGFLIMPVIVYRRTSALQPTLSVFVMEILLIVILGIMVTIFYPQLAFLPPFLSQLPPGTGSIIFETHG
jgi:hypothetical protein